MGPSSREKENGTIKQERAPREAVHAQTQVSRTNVQERVAKMELWENEVQADFTASMRLTTRNYYELDGPV